MKKNELMNMANELEIVMENDVFMVSSLAIAERFERQHKDVLRDIQRIIAECPEEFNGRNFALVEYVDAIRELPGPNGAVSECSSVFSALNFKEAVYLDEQGKARPMYNLTRNGFSMLNSRG